MVIVPDVVGMSSSAASAILDAAGFGAVELHYLSTAEVPPDTVVSQSPAAGTVVERSDTVTIELSADD
jgi:beta-lactam-binding protein with PASTA domain